jgi:hypothetical protein
MEDGDATAEDWKDPNGDSLALLVLNVIIAIEQWMYIWTHVKANIILSLVQR